MSSAPELRPAALAVAPTMAAILAAAAGILLLHEAFPRKAALFRMEITPGWLLSAAAALGGVALCGWWTFRHTEYADQSVMKMIGDKDVARAIRSSAAAAITLMAIGVWRL